MTTEKFEEGIHALIITKEHQIEAPIEIAFAAMIEELSALATGPNNALMAMKLEPWPGGRWYRDLGEGSGHLWAHVQVIKPPKLLELCGPLFMSYPAVNHLQYRLVEEGKITRLSFTHRGMGQIPLEHREGVSDGWEEWNSRVKKRAESMVGKQGDTTR